MRTITYSLLSGKGSGYLIILPFGILVPIPLNKSVIYLNLFSIHLSNKYSQLG